MRHRAKVDWLLMDIGARAIAMMLKNSCPLA
jgi:hypothetical protein